MAESILPGDTQSAELRLEPETSKSQTLILFIVSWLPHTVVEGQDVCAQCQSKPELVPASPRSVVDTHGMLGAHAFGEGNGYRHSLPTPLSGPGFLS